MSYLTRLSNKLPSFSVKSGNYPPEYKTTLPHTILTERALRQIDRRSRLHSTAEKTAQASDYKNIQEFARHGGPDLSDLRWYPEPEDNRVISLDTPASEGISPSPWDDADVRTTLLKGLWTESRNLEPEEYKYMSVEDLMKGVVKRYGSQGSGDLNADLQSARQTHGLEPDDFGENRPNKRPKPSSAYNSDFLVKLASSHIYFVSTKAAEPRSKPGNLEQARHYLSKRRASLSAENFGEHDFDSFVTRSYDALTEDTVMQKLIPVIAGKDNHIESQSSVTFKNFRPVTGVETVHAVPDFYDGSDFKDLHERIKHELNEFVCPSASSNCPIVPNFFFEGKRPSAAGNIAELQVLYDGALGARCMHKLRNYSSQEESYDGNAYSWSAIYHGGLLRLFAHHVTAPITPHEGTNYRMTLVRGYDMYSDLETFVKGATAFRNLREFALAQRKESINDANARARADS